MLPSYSIKKHLNCLTAPVGICSLTPFGTSRFRIVLPSKQRICLVVEDVRNQAGVASWKRVGFLENGGRGDMDLRPS